MSTLARQLYHNITARSAADQPRWMSRGPDGAGPCATQLIPPPQQPSQRRWTSGLTLLAGGCTTCRTENKFFVADDTRAGATAWGAENAGPANEVPYRCASVTRSLKSTFAS